MSLHDRLSEMHRKGTFQNISTSSLGDVVFNSGTEKQITINK